MNHVPNKQTTCESWRILAFVSVCLLVGCDQRSSTPNSVTVSLASWERPHFVASGSNAMVFYVLYGEFPTNLTVSAKTFRTAGLPEGVEIRKLSRAQRPVFPFTDGDFAKTAGTDNLELFTKLQTVPECLILQGEIVDPKDLNYLRDTIGLTTWFLDHGGIAVMDVQQLRLFSPEDWRTNFFDPNLPQPLKHVVILHSDETDGKKWFHTRGLRKFGRPDLSLHHVAKIYEAPTIELFERFIILQAEGGQIPEGQEIRMKALPTGMTCRHAGSFDDFDFNNVHVEIRWQGDR